jgi:antitoxin component YwqK of YwqJK toxin-antitoxin module
MENIINKNDNGQLHGIQIGYHDNGKIWYKENYINGNQHGEQIVNYPNGQISIKCHYINGNEVSHSEWIIYNRKLKMKMISNL